MRNQNKTALSLIFIINKMNEALIYEHGKVVPKNLKLAVEYYEKAVKMKHTGSMNNLACKIIFCSKKN